MPDQQVHLPAVLASTFGISSSEARRLIQQGGVRIAGRRHDPACLDLPAADIDGEQVLVGRSLAAVVHLEPGAASAAAAPEGADR